MTRLAALAMLAIGGCSAPPSPRPPANTPPPAPPAAVPSAIAFRTGRPADVYHDYAIERWGPNGPSTFTSPASVHPGRGFTLLEVGRYAIVDVPNHGGFYVRDVGDAAWVDAAWVTELEMRGSRIVLEYAARDHTGEADTAALRAGRTPMPMHANLHQIVEVWSFADGATPRVRVVFAHEYGAWAQCCGSETGLAPPRIEDDVDVGEAAITLHAREAWRARPDTVVDLLPDIAHVIAPWDRPATAVYRWTGTRFESR